MRQGHRKRDLMNHEPLRTIEREVASWPGVSTGDTGRGGLQLNYGRVELGHLHGSGLGASAAARLGLGTPEDGWSRRRGSRDRTLPHELRTRTGPCQTARPQSPPGDDLLGIELVLPEGVGLRDRKA